MALSEIDLMNQYHNRYLLALIAVLNALSPHEKISSHELTERIKRTAGETSPYSDTLIDELIQNACENGILILEKSTIQKESRETIFLPMTIQEKIYLKNILKSPYAVLFLDKPVIQELLDKLSEIPDLNFSENINFSGIREDIDFDEDYIQNFRLLMQAVQERRKISFVNSSASGQEFPNYSKIPFKIEYSVIMRCFWLSLWNQREKRPFKANISRISDIKLLERISDEEYQEVIHMMELKREQNPIIMTVRNENYAIERINLLFSMYHKKIERVDKDTIKISLSYYQFDENEIIDGIMSFGKAVHVLSPERVVNKIKEKLSSY